MDKLYEPAKLFFLKYFELISFKFIMFILLGRFTQTNCKNYVTLLNVNPISIIVERWDVTWGWDRAVQLKHTVLGSFIQTVW